MIELSLNESLLTRQSDGWHITPSCKNKGVKHFKILTPHEGIDFFAELIHLSFVEKLYRVELDSITGLNKSSCISSEQIIPQSDPVVTCTLIFKSSVNAYICLIATSSLNANGFEYLIYSGPTCDRIELLKYLDDRNVDLMDFLDDIFPSNEDNKRQNQEDYFRYAFDELVNRLNGLETLYRATRNGRRVQDLGFRLLGSNINLAYDIKASQAGLVSKPEVKITHPDNNSLIAKYINHANVDRWLKHDIVYILANKE